MEYLIYIILESLIIASCVGITAFFLMYRHLKKEQHKIDLLSMDGGGI